MLDWKSWMKIYTCSRVRGKKKELNWSHSCLGSTRRSKKSGIVEEWREGRSSRSFLES